jgi:uncharacterized glyoxalase superfamily protein PhnB
VADLEPDISPIIPFLHYSDLDAAASWLPRVFGLRLRSIESDAAGEASMAVFQHHNGLIFARHDPRATALSGGRLYVYVDDVDAHYAQVSAHGVAAEEPRDQPWGDRAYDTYDLQGHPWTFATPSA